MKYSFTLFLLISGIIQYSQAQHSSTEMVPILLDSLAIKYARTINESDLRNYLSILSSDALEGRETGSRGQKMAAAFIREHFKDNKLKPLVTHGEDSLYFQEFGLYRTFNKEIYLQSENHKFTHPGEIFYIGNANIVQPESVVMQFIGDGEEEDYLNLEVSGNIVAYYAQTTDEIRNRRKMALDRGAMGVMVINSKTPAEFEAFRDQQAIRSHSISKNPPESGDNILFFTDAESVASMLGLKLEKLTDIYHKKRRSGKNRFRKLNNEIQLKIERVSEPFETENVLGFLEGKDKKEELIVVTAHYDHVGSDGTQIYNGADDDGSGTAAVMELAQAFAKAAENGDGPLRSMLFMTVAGEENGLLGSEYYSEHPQWPLNQTVANLNIDMIGRVDPMHENQDKYVYIIGSDRLSMDLHHINEQVNQLYTGLALDYKYNAEDDPNRFYFRSDHYNFAKHNIPIIFYFNGTHADYHQPTDTIEKIRFDLLKKRADLIFYCAWELANRPERVRLNQ